MGPKSPDNSSENAKKTRRRASHACSRCRERKVRCNVTAHGPPCLNCQLDGDKCEVALSRRVKRFLQKRVLEVDKGISKPFVILAAVDESQAQDICQNEIFPGKAPDELRKLQLPKPKRSPVTTIECRPSNEEQHAATVLMTQVHDDGERSPLPVVLEETEDGGEPITSQEKMGDATGCGKWQEEIRNRIGVLSPSPSSIAQGWEVQAASIHAEDVSANPFYVSYSYSQFLTITNLSALLPQDFQFLERQGCLHVPRLPVLNEFMRQYFLNLQPVLPILDEGAFWDVYAQRPNSCHLDNKVSLVLFQAMLFSCCNFVSDAMLSVLGFTTKRSARASFYRRAKFLFDFETEHSLIDKSRAALLLASWSFSSYEVPRTPNTPWLVIAIHLAKEAEAHRYVEFDVNSVGYAARKRLWWGCIIRDRLLSLGMRRGIHILPKDFDFNLHPTLGPADLEDEVGRSMVYEPETQRHLHELLGMLTSLCVVLTDILDLTFPIEDSLKRCRHRKSTLAALELARKTLRRWYNGTTHRLCSLAAPPEQDKQEDSVFLYVHLLYMYYYAAKIALGHHEILHMAIVGVSVPTGHSNIGCFHTSRADLQDSVIATTRCLEKLMHSRLVKRLPITAISCTALPLLLHALHVEKQSSDELRDKQRIHAMNNRLVVLKAAMETYQYMYEGVDWISSAIKHVVSLAPKATIFDSEAFKTHREAWETPNDGEKTIGARSFEPGFYLRLAFTLDIAFSKGRLPEVDGFPGGLPELPRPKMEMAKAPPGQQEPKQLSDVEASSDRQTSVTTLSEPPLQEAELLFGGSPPGSGHHGFDMEDFITTSISYEVEGDHRLSGSGNLTAAMLMSGEGQSGALDWYDLLCGESGGDSEIDNACQTLSM